MAAHLSSSHHLVGLYAPGEAMDLLQRKYSTICIMSGVTGFNPSLLARFAVVLFIRVPGRVHHDELDRVLMHDRPAEPLGQTIPCIHGYHIE
jgi:hypothetical protein